MGDSPWNGRSHAVARPVVSGRAALRAAVCHVRAAHRSGHARRADASYPHDGSIHAPAAAPRLPRATGFRYVRIQLALRGAPEDAIAVLGHELQHAVEVAEAIDVIDAGGLEKLYRRIGVRSGPQVYDTIAAQELGKVVRRELAG